LDSLFDISQTTNQQNDKNNYDNYGDYPNIHNSLNSFFEKFIGEKTSDIFGREETQRAVDGLFVFGM
jgi:hypothetical protein